MTNKGMKVILITVLITLGLLIYSWFHVAGKEIDGVLEISPECSVIIRVGLENQQEYTLDAERIYMLQNLILTSSFRKAFANSITYPTGTEHYNILVDWNNQQDFLTIHSSGNEYISIPDQFNGKLLKVKNPEWERL